MDGTLSEEHQQVVLDALSATDTAPPPAKVSDTMQGDCAKIRYVFTWTESGMK